MSDLQTLTTALKQRLQAERDSLLDKTAINVLYSENGPVPLDLFVALMNLVEEQGREIERLKQRVK